MTNNAKHDKVTNAINTLTRVVPVRFSGELLIVKAEIERLQKENKLLESFFEESDRNKERYASEVEYMNGVVGGLLGSLEVLEELIEGDGLITVQEAIKYARENLD